jgi:hypothetical protein
MPFMREVKTVRTLPDYLILVEFDNAEKRIKDMKPLLSNPVFKPLLNKVFFNTAKIVNGAVTWGDIAGEEIDLCPDSLYMSSKPFDCVL